VSSITALRHQGRHRLQASIVETRRADGEVSQKHIAGLGSILVQPDEILWFWRSGPVLTYAAKRLPA
jgi:hypothetical protein